MNKKTFIKALSIFSLALIAYIYTLVTDDVLDPHILDAFSVIIGIGVL